MRTYHAIAIVAAVLVVFGLKLFFAAPIAEADVAPVKSLSMELFDQNNKNLPVENFHDMTFVFSDGD